MRDAPNLNLKKKKFQNFDLMIFVRIVSRYDVTSELCKNNQFGCFLLLLSSPHPCPYYLDVVFYFIFRNAHVNYGIFPFSLSLSLLVAAAAAGPPPTWWIA
jgi:hypothetical protein